MKTASQDMILIYRELDESEHDYPSGITDAVIWGVDETLTAEDIQNENDLDELDELAHKPGVIVLGVVQGQPYHDEETADNLGNGTISCYWDLEFIQRIIYPERC